MTIILILGFSLMLVAPLLRRYKLASLALGAGAGAIVALATLQTRTAGMAGRPSKRIVVFIFSFWPASYPCSLSR